MKPLTIVLGTVALTFLSASMALADGALVTPGVPPATVYESVRPNRPLLVAGAVVVLAAYAPTVILTAASNDPKTDQVLYLPLIGPWAHLASPTASTSVTTVDTMLVIGSGVVQGIGAVIMLTSLFVPEHVALPTVQAGTTTVQFGPTSFGVASAGAGAVGSF